MASKKALVNSSLETINFEELGQLIKYLDPSLALMLHGPPGAGKSAWILANPALEPCTQIGLATRQPEDISGCPYPLIEQGITKFLPLDWLRTYSIGGPQGEDPKGCIFFDEYDKGTPEKQVAVMRLLSEREMEGLKIGPNVRIILAANRREDQAGVFHDMPRVVRNRLVHYQIEPDLKYWMENFAYKHGNIHSLVTTYLDRAPGDFMQYDPKTADFGFPTPRSWTAVSKILHAVTAGMSNSLAFKSMVGAVGSGIATKFQVIMNHMEKLPKLEDLISGKADFPGDDVFDEWIALVSTCLSTAEAGIRSGTKKDLKGMQKVCKIIMKMPETKSGQEFRFLLIKSLSSRPSTSEYFLHEAHHETPGLNKLIGKVLQQSQKEQQDAGMF